MSFKLGIGLTLLLVCASSVGWRMVLEDSPTPAESAVTSSDAGTGSGAGGAGFLPGTPTGGGSGGGDPTPTKSPADGEPTDESPLEAWLPVVTESSFFAFIGFALGYFSRKVLKLALIFIALIFLLLQGLTMAGVVTVDWGRAIELVNTWILDLKENQPVTAMLKERIPAAGGLLAGVLLGWRKG